MTMKNDLQPQSNGGSARAAKIRAERTSAIKRGERITLRQLFFQHQETANYFVQCCEAAARRAHIDGAELYHAATLDTRTVKPGTGPEHLRFTLQRMVRRMVIDAKRHLFGRDYSRRSVSVNALDDGGRPIVEVVVLPCQDDPPMPEGTQDEVGAVLAGNVQDMPVLNLIYSTFHTQKRLLKQAELAKCLRKNQSSICRALRRERALLRSRLFRREAEFER